MMGLQQMVSARLVKPLADWGAIVHFAAMTVVLAFTPSTYRREHRGLIVNKIYSATWQVLPAFTLLSALISLVLIRIVVVTAKSYGLSQFALEVVVRVLVLELIPLSAALFVVLRTSVAAMVQHSPQPQAAGHALGQGQGQGQGEGQGHGTWVVGQELSNAIASAFSVLTLTAVSSVLALFLAYVVVYGMSPWGFDDYTRMVGRVFDPAVVIIFVLKTLLFSLAVAVVPSASQWLATRSNDARQDGVPTSLSVGTVRLFFLLALIEGASLAVKYI